MRRFVCSELIAGIGEVERFDASQEPGAFADWVRATLESPRRFDGSRRYALILWALPPGAGDPGDVPLDHYSRRNYIQCGGSAEAMTVEIRVTGADGAYEHYRVAREPVRDPGAWVEVEWDFGGGEPFTAELHPEEVFTGCQASPVFHDYIVNGGLPPAELLRRLDV